MFYVRIKSHVAIVPDIQQEWVKMKQNGVYERYIKKDITSVMAKTNLYANQISIAAGESSVIR